MYNISNDFFKEEKAVSKYMRQLSFKKKKKFEKSTTCDTCALGYISAEDSAFIIELDYNR